MSVDIVSLQCPVCGAPFSPNDEKCGYCGSILVLRTDHPKISPSTLNRQVVDKHIVEYRQTLKRDHADSTAHYGLGVAYFNLGLTDDSVRELEEAARLMPENPNIQSQLAVVLKQSLDDKRPGAADKLRDRIEYTLRLDPDNYDALLLKAETDSKLSRLEAFELLEKAHNAHPDRPSDRLIAALSQMVMSERYLGDREFDLLKRMASIDNPTARKPLFTAILRTAKMLSESAPVADMGNPGRAAKALDLWKELFTVDNAGAGSELGKYLLLLPDISKSDLKKVRTLLDNQATNKPLASVSKPRPAAPHKVAGVSKYIKAILVGLLKAVGILIATILLVAYFVIDLEVIGTIAAAVSILLVFVLPVLLPILEVRKMKPRTVRNLPAPPLKTPEPPKAEFSSFGSQQYTELISILKGYFTQRWKRQSVLRITTDSSNSGVRGERARNKAFLASMSK